VSSGFEHSVRVQLRWRDMDMLGHLNQSVYHELLEEGRVALVAELVRRLGDDHAHGGYVLAHVDLDYLTEVRKDHGEVDVVVRLSHVGTSSFRLDNEIRLPDGTVAASGSSGRGRMGPACADEADPHRTRAGRALMTGDSPQ
jgi:acyl-CoA thioester hydrolase